MDKEEKAMDFQENFGIYSENLDKMLNLATKRMLALDIDLDRDWKNTREERLMQLSTNYYIHMTCFYMIKFIKQEWKAREEDRKKEAEFRKKLLYELELMHS